MATMTKNKRRNRSQALKAVAGALALARQLRRLPESDLWLDYDREADVLYISFQRPQNATDTIELDDGGVLLRYRENDLVGVTVLNASKK